MSDCSYLVWSWGDMIRCVDCGKRFVSPNEAKELKKKWLANIDRVVEDLKPFYCNRCGMPHDSNDKCLRNKEKT